VGAAGGSQNVTLSVGNLPSHTHGVSDSGHTHGYSDPTHSHSYSFQTPSFASQYGAGGLGAANNSSATGGSTGASGVNIVISNAVTGITIQATGSGTAVPVLQPFMTTTKLIRAL
jgi:microcystin-dependent protein